MFTFRGYLLACSFISMGFLLVPGVCNAQASYFTSTESNKNCSNSGCHTASIPLTCTGCHGHGTHGTSAKNSMNLVASTDKASYAPGEDISVKLSGSYKPTGWISGWVRVNVYAGNGTLLVSNSTECPHNALSYAAGCDLPVTLKTRAVSGMTNLYVAWMGNEYDEVNAAKGAPVSSTIGVGKRTAPAPAPAGHVEEIVLTNTFSVTTASESGGGGLLDWVLISGLLGLGLLRRTAAGRG